MIDLYKRKIYISLDNGKKWFDVSVYNDLILLDEQQTETVIQTYDYDELLKEATKNKYHYIKSEKTWFTKQEVLTVYIDLQPYRIKNKRLKLAIKKEYSLSKENIETVAQVLSAQDFIRYLKIKDFTVSIVEDGGKRK